MSEPTDQPTAGKPQPYTEEDLARVEVKGNERFLATIRQLHGEREQLFRLCDFHEHGKKKKNGLYEFIKRQLDNLEDNDTEIDRLKQELTEANDLCRKAHNTIEEQQAVIKGNDYGLEVLNLQGEVNRLKRELAQMEDKLVASVKEYDSACLVSGMVAANAHKAEQQLDRLKRELDGLRTYSRNHNRNTYTMVHNQYLSQLHAERKQLKEAVRQLKNDNAAIANGTIVEERDRLKQELERDAAYHKEQLQKANDLADYYGGYLDEEKERGETKDKVIEKLKACLEEVSGILKAPASNRRFMQVAQPARQCRNIIKEALTTTSDNGEAGDE